METKDMSQRVGLILRFCSWESYATIMWGASSIRPWEDECA